MKVLGSHKYSQEFLEIWDTKRNNSYEKWVLVDDYNLIEGLERNRNDETVHSMEIISSHFDQSQAKIKILFFYDTKYSIMDIVIKLSTFREFIVEISQHSTVKYGFKVDKIWTESKTHGNNIYAFAKISTGRQKSFTNTLIKVKIDEKETKDEFSVLWKTETLKADNIRTILGANYLGVINDDEGIVYIFELFEERYSGYIDLNRVFPNIKGNSQAKELAHVSDLLFCRDHAKGSLIVYYKDSVLLFSQKNTEHLDSFQDEAWTLIHRFDEVLNLDVIKSVKMVESYYGQLMFIINKKYFLSRNRFLAKIDHSIFTLHNKENDTPQNVTFEGLFTIFQESKPIYHPQLLKQFYIKGHINLVLKILVKMNKLLQFETKAYKIPSLCEFSLQEIINELQIDKVETKKEQPKKVQDTAASLFDNMFSWESDAKESQPLFTTKKEEEKKETKKDKNTLAEDFEEIKESLIQSLSGKQRDQTNLSEKSKNELIIFIKVFEKLYTKEFYSDVLSDSLLRKFNYDKDFNILVEESSKEIAKAEDNYGVFKTAAQKILESIKTEQSNQSLEPWNTMQVACAYHSKDQDVIFNQIQTDEIDWLMFQKLSIPIWLKDTSKLKSLIEGVAKTVYRKAGEEVGLSSRAAVTAIWYIIIDKKSLL